MSNQVLTLGIVLTLGAAGCAGFSAQGSSLITRVQTESGLDNLWNSSEKAPVGGFQTPAYAEQSLGGLWNRTGETISGVDATSREYQSRGDLWNPPSVARSWEIDPVTAQRSPARGLILSDSLRRRRSERRVSAQ